jgi:hypothetical protein
MIHFLQFTKQDVINYKKTGKFTTSYSNRRNYHDTYFATFCNILNNNAINNIKYPICSIREPGINMNIVKNKIKKNLRKKNITILLNKNYNNNNNNNNNFVVNAMGYENKSVNKSLLELKSCWNFSLENIHDHFPEIAIIGERNTENGLLQISPTKNNFQIHYMNKNSSIFECVKNFSNFSQESIDVIKHQTKNIFVKRSNVALQKTITFFNYFKYALFKSAEWGIQRIPTECNTDRIATIKINIFNKTADIEIVKGISSVYAACELKKKLTSID